MLIPDRPTISSRCGSSSCVEVTLNGLVQVRDTKPGGAAVVFTVDAWRHLVAGLKAEELIEKKEQAQ